MGHARTPRTRVLRSGPRGREPGLRALTTALGFGVAVGVLAVSVLQKRVPKEQVFAGRRVVAGVSLATAAPVSWLSVALLAVAVLGVCTGTVYVLGFTLFHQNVSDALRGGSSPRLHARLAGRADRARGRSAAVGPLGNLSESLLDDSRFEIGSVSVFVPGVRPPSGWPRRSSSGRRLAIRSLRSATPEPVPPTVGGGVSAQGARRRRVSVGDEDRAGAGRGRFIALEGGEGIGKSTQAWPSPRGSARC